MRLGMFEVHCDELIRSLAKRADALCSKLLARMSKDHQEANKALCDEYETIAEKALTTPASTEQVSTASVKQLDHFYMCFFWLSRPKSFISSDHQLFTTLYNTANTWANLSQKNQFTSLFLNFIDPRKYNVGTI